MNTVRAEFNPFIEKGDGAEENIFQIPSFSDCQITEEMKTFGAFLKKERSSKGFRQPVDLTRHINELVKINLSPVYLRFLERGAIKEVPDSVIIALGAGLELLPLKMPLPQSLKKEDNWIVNDGKIQLKVGESFIAQMINVLSSKLFVDPTMEYNERVVCFSRAQINFQKRQPLFIEGGLYYGAVRDGVRMGWEMELKMENFGKPKNIYFNVASAQFFTHSQNGTVRFFGMYTRNLLEGPISFHCDIYT